jgi:hypothetical protein
MYKNVMALQQRLQERVHSILIRAALQQNKISVGNPETAVKGRRRPAPAHHFDEYSDESHPDISAFDSKNDSFNGSSNSGGGAGRFMGQVQRLFNVATSRIHPASSSTGSARMPDNQDPPAPTNDGVSSTANSNANSSRMDEDMTDI